MFDHATSGRCARTPNVLISDLVSGISSALTKNASHTGRILLCRRHPKAEELARLPNEILGLGGFFPGVRLPSGRTAQALPSFEYPMIQRFLIKLFAKSLPPEACF
jgi:hypothetical protein